MKTPRLSAATVLCCALGSAHASAEVLMPCNVEVDFAVKPQRKVLEGEGGQRQELLIATSASSGSQTAFCGPGAASSAAEMRELTSFIPGNRKLRNLSSRVVKTPAGWMYLAEADSTASDGVTTTRFEYQCSAYTSTRQLLCLTVGAAKDGFPRNATDRFFESARPLGR